MNSHTCLLAASVSIVTLMTGCTANPYTPERKFAEVSEMRLVELAGSRIPRMVDIESGEPLMPTPVTLITRDDIDAANASGLADILGFYSFNFSGGGGSR